MTKEELKAYRARAKKIVRLRDVKKMTFQQIAAELGMKNRQRVYQIYLREKAK